MTPWPSLRRVAKNLLRDQLGIHRGRGGNKLPRKVYKKAVTQVVKGLVELQNKKEEETRNASDKRAA